MRPITLLIGLFLFCNHASGQISFTSANYAQVGDSFHVSVANSGLTPYNFDTTGADFSWQFDTLPVNTQDDVVFIDPNDAGYKFLWCLANGYIFTCNAEFNDLTNLGQPQLDGFSLGGLSISNVLDHLKNEPDQVENRMLGITIDVGGIGIPVSFEYEKPDTLYQFPLNYTDVDSSTSRLVIDLSDIGVDFAFTSESQRFTEVDGWGSLTTPYDSFPNTLRIKTTQISFDTISLGGTSIPTTTTTIYYQWFDLDYGIPVLEARGLAQGSGNAIINQITYIDSLRCLTPNAFFAYLPLFPSYDPLSQSATVNFTNLSSNQNSLLWDFGDGTTSVNTNPEHTFLCPGLQNVRLIANNSVCDPLQSDTIDLPVFIIDTAGVFSADSFFASICEGDSLFIGGAWQFDAGSYTDVFVDNNGCDSSVITTLSVLAHTFAQETYAGCQGDGYSLIVNGTIYDETNPSGEETLANAAGCDSLITINLVFEPSSSGAENYIGCSGDGYEIDVNGTSYNENNPTGVETLANAAGCDSLITINLVFEPSSSGAENYIGCSGDGYEIDVNGTSYNENNPTGVETLANAAGCDSLITINLVFDTINTELHLSDTLFTALEMMATYQWLDCFENYAPIPGATGISFSIIPPGGVFAVELTVGNCVDTSFCISNWIDGITGTSSEHQVDVYPNPFSDEFQIVFWQEFAAIHVELVTMSGQVVHHQQVLSSDRCTIRPKALPSGLYLLKLSVGNQVFRTTLYRR